jgi:hypothetical protein
MRSKTKLITLVVGFILTFSLFLAPLATFIPLARAQTEWTKYSGELTMGGQKYVVDAWVILDGSTYKMWYTHGATDMATTDIYNDIKGLSLDDLVTAFINRDEDDFLDNLSDLNPDTSTIKAIADGSSTVIGYATSTDGKTWAVQQANALVGSTGGFWTNVGAPCVIKDGTTYKMWYTGIYSSLTESQLQTIFTNFAGNDSSRSTALTNLLNSTYTYIGYATSSDGATWTDQGKVFSLSGGTWTCLNSVAAPCVIKDDTTYKMWFTRIKTDVTQAQLDSLITDIGTDDFTMSHLVDLLDGTTTVIGYATSTSGTTWNLENSEVLTGGPAAWQSVADPSVIKHEGHYGMLFTNSDINLTKANLASLKNEIWQLDMSTLWNSAKTKSLSDFLTDLLNEAGSLDITTIKSLLTGSRSTIGCAFSNDGIDWDIVDEQLLTGRGNNPWGSIAAPSLIVSGTYFELWYTDGVDDITWQNFLDLFLGDNFPIGYATYQEPSAEGKPRTGPPAAAPKPGTTSLSGKVTSSGQFTADVTAESSDDRCSITIPKGTVGLDANGNALKEITIEPMADPPPPPAQHNVIGLTYEFGPAGATFDPPITLTFTYDPSLIPAGISEESLVLAVWNAETGEWDELVCTVDPATNTITATISHFSLIAILVSTRPAAFTASNLSISPAEVDIGEAVTISVRVTNSGDYEGAYEVILSINNVVAQSKVVTLDGGKRQTVTFTASKDAAGTYSVSVDGLSGTFTVKEAAPPVVPKPPAPAAFTTSSLVISPSEVDIGKTVTISIQLSNTGELEGTHTVTLKINGAVVDSRNVTLGGGASQSVTFFTSRDAAGAYTVEINGLSGTFTVKEAPPTVPPEVPVTPKPAPFNWWLVIGPVIGVVVIGLLVWLLVVRRRAY